MNVDEISKKSAVKIFGKGTQPMLFLHGYGCNQEMWRFITPSFSEDYKIILMDLVGCGRSDNSYYDFEKYQNLNAYSYDLIEVCDSYNLRDVIFVGHSVSSMIGVLAANERPDLFSKLILIGPSPRYINDANYYGGFEHEQINELLDFMDSNYLGWSNFITPIIIGNPESPELTKELNDSFCSNDPKIAKHFGRVVFMSDNRDDLAKVVIPTLVIQTEVDSIAPIEVGTYVANTIPNATLKIIKAVGHNPHMTHPNETITAIKDFL